MWQTKVFKTEDAARAWIARNAHRYQADLIFLDNAYGVEYKQRRRL